MNKTLLTVGAAGFACSILAAVPTPWTPVQATGTKISVWGRDYTFGEQAFPTSILATGDDILAGPIRIVAAGTNGAESVWKSGGSWVEEKSDERVTVCAWQQSDVLIADVIAKIDYDGMTKVTLTMLPQINQPVFGISKAWLEIPLKPEFAKLRATFPRIWGKTENAGGIHDKPFAWCFKPSVWIGNEEKGLNWFCESDEMFVNDDPNRVIEVIPGAKETVLRIRFCDHYVARVPFKWTFGLQATPIKPFNRAWNENHVIHHMKELDAEGKNVANWKTLAQPDAVRRFQPSIQRVKTAGAKTVVFHEDWIRIQNDPESVQPLFKDVVKACHDAGLKVLVYQGYEISSLDPLWQEFGESVVNYDATRCMLPVFWCRQPAQRDFPVCYQSAFARAWLERAKKMYDELQVDGYYLDGTIMPSACVNHRHGCGWKDAKGVVHETYPIFAVREMMKELYAFVEGRGGVINAHQSGCVCAPTLAFCHSYWDGEQLAYSSGDIRAMLDLEVCRAEFMGRPFGIPCEFLSAERPGKWTYADGLAVMLIHDVFPRPNGPKTEHYLTPVWKVYDAFGATKAEWKPYWKKPLATTPESVRASVYLKDGKALVVAANLAHDGEALAEIALPAGLSTAKNAVTGEPLAVDGGKVRVKLAAFTHIMIEAN